MIVSPLRKLAAVATLFLVSATVLADDPPPPTSPTPVPQIQFLDPAAPLPPGDLTPSLLLDGISIFNLYDPTAPLPTTVDPLVATVASWVAIVQTFHSPATLLDLLFPPSQTSTMTPPPPPPATPTILPPPTLP